MHPPESQTRFLNLLVLQPLPPEFLPAVLELDQQCFGGLWSAAGYSREIESPNSDLLVLMRQDPPHPVAIGCSWAILEEAHITLLGVDPGYRRLGLGQWLLCALLRQGCQRGLERATLEVRISNQSAIALYQKLGFREAGRRRRYYQDTGEDALILWQSGLQLPKFIEQLNLWQQQAETLARQAGWQLVVDSLLAQPQN